MIELLRRNRHLVLLLISGLLLPLITEIGASWLQESLGRTPARLIQILAVLVALAVGLWALALALRTEPEPVSLVARDAQPPRCRGLIALVGPGRPDDDPMEQSAVRAIEYHLQAGTLTYCWLIASGGERGSVPVAERIRQAYEDRCQVFVRQVGDAFSVQDTYDVVRRIYEQEIIDPQQGLTDRPGAAERARRAHLRRLLANRFSLGELQALCFDLGVKYENLPGDTLEVKATELVAYCERHGQMEDLVRIGRKQRPDVQWQPEQVPGAEPSAQEAKVAKGPALLPEEVIADFTGATKPMSAGMVLACGRDRPMQYVTGYKPGIASTPLLVRFEPAGRRR